MFPMFPSFGSRLWRVPYRRLVDRRALVALEGLESVPEGRPLDSEWPELAGQGPRRYLLATLDGPPRRIVHRVQLVEDRLGGEPVHASALEHVGQVSE